ncbi:hypothetical protein [Roseovarius sp.]|jgi:uncharacterized protein YfkK (UPF0435 family)
MDEARKQMILKSTMDKVNSIPEADLIWIMRKIGLNIQDDYGNTVLHVAASAGMDGICNALTELGASANIPNRDGQRPADLALEAGHLPLALSLRTNKDHSLLNHTSAESSNGKNLIVSGTFLPTSETQLLNSDEDWSLPDELREDKISKNEIIEVKFAAEIDRFNDIFSELGLKPEQCVISLYLKLAGIIEKLNMINQSMDFAGSRCVEGDIEEEIMAIIFDKVLDSHAAIESRLVAIIKSIRESVKKIHGIYASPEYSPSDGRSFQKLNEVLDTLASDDLKLKESLNDLVRISEPFDDLGYIYDLAPIKSLRDSYLEMQVFQDAISDLCSIVSGDLMENRESADEDLLRLDIKIDVPEDLNNFLHEIEYEPSCTNKDHRGEFSMIWDGRIWQEEGSS